MSRWLEVGTGMQPYFAGEVVRLMHDLVRGDDALLIPYWQVRVVQERTDGFAQYCQAVPMGVWPARFAWLPECFLEPTGLRWPVLSFEMQDRLFQKASRGRQIEARRQPLPLREPLEEETALVEELRRLELDYRGVNAEAFRKYLVRIAAAGL